MAFELVSAGGINVEPTMVEVLASGAVAIGDHVSPQLYGSGYTARQFVTRLGSATTTYSLFGIACDAVTSGTKFINVILINGAQLWKADTTAATNVNQAFKCNALSTHAYIANSVVSGSGAIGSTYVWQNLGYVGATSDNKAIGRFVSPFTVGVA